MSIIGTLVKLGWVPRRPIGAVTMGHDLLLAVDGEIESRDRALH